MVAGFVADGLGLKSNTQLRPPPSGLYWIAVSELNLSYSIKETVLITNPV